MKKRIVSLLLALCLGLLAGCAFYVFLMWVWVPLVGK